MTNLKAGFRLILCLGTLLCAPHALALTVTINTPAEGLVVSPNQTVPVNVSVSGSVAGIQTIVFQCERDASHESNVYSYPPTPPTLSVNETYNYQIPANAGPGEVLVIQVTVVDYVDGPTVVTRNVVGAGTVVPPPSNDNFADAQVITGISGSRSGTNTGATKEPGEPQHAGDSGGKSVWYEWQADHSTSATIHTFGSNFDTLLGVYTGSQVNGLTSIAANDQTPGSNQSSVEFMAVAGETYYIAVDGYIGAGTTADSGTILITWSQDAQANALDWVLYE